MTASIDVILPGLFQLPLEEFDREELSERFPGLNHILRFSSKNPQQLYDFESLLADSLGLQSTCRLPFSRAFDDRQETRSSLLCEAVHLKPDMHNAYILPLDQLDETNEHISIVINDIADFFKDDFNLTNVYGNTWLMHLHRCPAPQQLPHSLSVIGRKADPYIKQSREVLAWYRLINEVQMFMHAHEVNRQRIRDGLLEINSLWCWGSGDPIDLADRELSMYCDDYLIGRFAENAGLGRQRLSDLVAASFTGHNICVDLGILQALKVPTGQNLFAELERIESELLGPLLSQVRQGKIRLRLRAGHEYDFEIGRFSRLKFWRRPIVPGGAIE